MVVYHVPFYSIFNPIYIAIGMLIIGLFFVLYLLYLSLSQDVRNVIIF